MSPAQYKSIMISHPHYTAWALTGWTIRVALVDLNDTVLKPHISLIIVPFLVLIHFILHLLVDYWLSEIQKDKLVFLLRKSHRTVLSSSPTCSKNLCSLYKESKGYINNKIYKEYKGYKEYKRYKEYKGYIVQGLQGVQGVQVLNLSHTSGLQISDELGEPGVLQWGQRPNSCLEQPQALLKLLK